MAVFFWLIKRVSDTPIGTDVDLSRSWQMVMIITICVIVMTSISVFIGSRILLMRGKILDDIFLPLGFIGSRFMGNARKYYRNSSGREVTIYIFKGPSLDIRIPVPVNVTMRVFRRDSIPAQMAGVLKTQSMVSQSSGLEDLVFFPADAVWMRGFLDRIRASGAIRTLITEGAEWAVFRQVELVPGELSFHLYESREINAWPLDQETVNRWVRALEDLSDELQVAGLPDFQVCSQNIQTSSGNSIEKNFTRSILLIPFIFLLIMVMIFILIMFLAYNY